MDQVLITHLHDDHLGWNVAEGTSEPMFPVNSGPNSQSTGSPYSVSTGAERSIGTSPSTR